MSEKKPSVLQLIPPRGVCPVCGKPSYSQTGTHPQCALARADAVSRADRKLAEADVNKPASRKSWTKKCRKCQREVPARRAVCDCGQRFDALASEGAPTVVPPQRREI